MSRTSVCLLLALAICAFSIKSSADVLVSSNHPYYPLVSQYLLNEESKDVKTEEISKDDKLEDCIRKVLIIRRKLTSHSQKEEDYQDYLKVYDVYARIVHDAYVKELEHNKELEFYCNYDTMTGLANFYSYRSFCNSFELNLSEKPVGVMFGDLNRLKYVNDTEGHEAGNVYIRTFAEKLKKAFF